MKLSLLTLPFMMAFALFAGAQTTILDFEDAATSTTFQYFGSTLDGSLTSTIANPNSSGINTSATVLEFNKPGGSEVWAGAFSNPDPTTAVDVTTSTQVCIKVHMDHIGNLALKLENSTTGGPNWLTTKANTLINEWEEICFDVTTPSEEDPFTGANGHVYSTVTVFFDFGISPIEDQVYYLDDVIVQEGSVEVECVTIIDHETAETTTNFQYFGGSLEGVINNVVANPNPSGINTSATVGEFIQGADAPVWGGAFSNPDPTIAIDVTNGTQICVKVHMDHVGNLALKLENSANGGPNWIVQKETTLVNEWEEICFDLSENSIEDPFLPAAGFVYPRVVLFFDFGIAGTGTDVLSYFDDLVVKSSGGGAEMADITFSVDMNEYTESFTQVYVSGTFNGWSGTSNPMSDDDMDGVWEVTLPLVPGDYQYKFTLDDWTVQEEFTSPASCTVMEGGFTNRGLTVTTSEALDTVCWNSCVACGVEEPTVTITINVGTNHIPVSADGIYIAGGGNFGVPGDFPLTDMDGDGVYTIVLERPVGFSSFYAFANGACADFTCKEDLTNQECAFPDNFNDRFMEPVMQDTVINTCYALCTDETLCADGAVFGEVTFRVDMNEYADPFTTVFVSGSFNNWASNANPMSDADQDGVWETTILLNGGNHEFKFQLDEWAVQEEFMEGDECTVTTGEFTNRILSVDGNATLEEYCWNACIACATSTSEINVDHNLFSVSPTVTRDITQLEFYSSSSEQIQIRVLNLQGQELAFHNLDGLTKNFPLNISNYQAGIYLVYVQIGDTIAAQKVIKQ